MRRPLALVGFTYLLALAGAACFGEGVAAVLSIASFLFFCIFLCYAPTRRAKTFPVVFLTAAVAFVSYCTAVQVQAKPAWQLSGYDARISGVVCELPYEEFGRFYYVVETDTVAPEGAAPGLPVPQRMKFRLSSTHALTAGAYDRIEGRVHFFTPDASQGFSSRSYYASKGIFELAYLYEYEEVTVTPGEERPLYYYALKGRESLLSALRNLLPPTQSAMAGGIFLGERHAIVEEMQDDFRNIGVSHLLAVSGLHLSLLVGFFLRLLKSLRLPERLAALLGCAAVILFMALTGFSPSVVRAGVMHLVYLLGLVIFRQPDTLNSLGAAVLLLTVQNPFAAGDMGLLLSFSATLGIARFSGPMERWMMERIQRLRFGKKLARAAGVILSATLSATLLTLPVLVMTFGRISPVSPLANLLLVPVANGVLLSAGLTSLLSYAGALAFLSYPFALLCGILCNFMTGCASLLANISYASVSATEGYFSLWIAGTLLLIAAAVLLFHRRKAPMRLCALLSVILLLTGMFSFQVVNQGTISLVVLNTEKDGYALLLCSGKEAALLACSGKGSTASQVDDYLRSRNLTQLSFALLPEQKGPTSAGAGHIVEKYRPQLLLLPRSASPDSRMRRDMQNAEEVRTYASSARVTFGEDADVTAGEQEGQSWVTVSIRGVRFLFCPAETELSRIPEQERQCDFLIRAKEASKEGMLPGTSLIHLNESGEAPETELVLPVPVYQVYPVQKRESAQFDITQNQTITILFRRE